jgi:hypothetical protein
MDNERIVVAGTVPTATTDLTGKRSVVGAHRWPTMSNLQFGECSGDSGARSRSDSSSSACLA